MSVLALIPARGGSKEIKRKNIKLISGKPLINWTIETAKKAECIDRLIVSTDDEEISEIAKKSGAEVPFMRPKEISEDNTPGIEPALHTIKQIPNFEWLLLLQPTSPLRSVEDIDGIFNFCIKNNCPSAVSVCEVNKHPYHMYHMNKSFNLKPFIKDRPKLSARQDFSPLYITNGALYLAKVDWLLKNKNFIGLETLGFTMPLSRSIDIDTMYDWNIAEQELNNK